jgi:hypothetical protein
MTEERRVKIATVGRMVFRRMQERKGKGNEGIE